MAKADDTTRRWPPSLICGTGLLVILACWAIAAPLFGSPLHQDLQSGLSAHGLPLGAGHGGSALGTDTLGRSMAARLAYGARTSLIVAILSTLTSLALGAGVGLIAAFYRGPSESVLMRITDAALAFPYVLAALVMAAFLPSGLSRVVIIITALFWAYPARLVYGEVLRLRRRGFVDAAAAMGSSRPMTIRRHLVPHLTPLLLTYAPLSAASAIFFEATLSYLGAGVNPPTPSWGNMISDGQTEMTIAPHLLVEPGVALFLATMAFLLIGDGLKRRNPDFARVSWLGV